MFSAVNKTVVRTENPDKPAPVDTEAVGLAEFYMEMHIYFPSFTLKELRKMSFRLLRVYAKEIDYRFQREIWFAQVASAASIKKLF